MGKSATSRPNHAARGALFSVEVVEHFMGDNCPQLAAALTYYAIFSLPPLLVLTAAGLGFFVDGETARQAIFESTSSFLSPRMARNVIGLLRDAQTFADGDPWWSLVVSIVGVAFGASRGFVQLQTALNRAWGIRPAASVSALREFLTKRLSAFLMLAATLPTIAVSTIISTLFSSFEEQLEPYLPPWFMTMIQAGLGTFASLALTTGLCAIIYRLLPDAKISWRQVFPGALMAGLGFELLKYGMSLYLNHLELDDVFGQASSLAAILIWLYVSANVLFIGAEFSQVWCAYRGVPVEPEKGAEIDPEASKLTLTPKIRDWLAEKGIAA